MEIYKNNIIKELTEDLGNFLPILDISIRYKGVQLKGRNISKYKNNITNIYKQISPKIKAFKDSTTNIKVNLNQKRFNENNLNRLQQEQTNINNYIDFFKNFNEEFKKNIPEHIITENEGKGDNKTIIKFKY